VHWARLVIVAGHHGNYSDVEGARGLRSNCILQKMLGELIGKHKKYQILLKRLDDILRKCLRNTQFLIGSSENKTRHLANCGNVLGQVATGSAVP